MTSCSSWSTRRSQKFGETSDIASSWDGGAMDSTIFKLQVVMRSSIWFLKLNRSDGVRMISATWNDDLVWFRNEYVRERSDIVNFVFETWMSTISKGLKVLGKIWRKLDCTVRCYKIFRLCQILKNCKTNRWNLETYLIPLSLLFQGSCFPNSSFRHI